MPLADQFIAVLGPFGGWIFFILLCTGPLLLSIYPTEYLIKRNKLPYQGAFSFFTFFYAIGITLILYISNMGPAVMVVFPVWLGVFAAGCVSLIRSVKRQR